MRQRAAARRSGRTVIAVAMDSVDSFVDSAALLDRIVVRAEPAHEIQHVRVPPHPRWKSPEARKRRVGVVIGSSGMSTATPGFGVMVTATRPVPSRSISETWTTPMLFGDRWV